jgi:hypothetical protein
MARNSSRIDLAIEYTRVEKLVSCSRNARTHSKKQVSQIAESIKAFGFTNPVLIDRNNIIIAGHGRVAAAKSLGMESVPTVRLESLTDDQIRAYVIADNRLAEKAGWDHSILAIELQHLLAIDGDFDVTITGFEIPEVDLIIQEARDEQRNEDDLFQIDETTQAVTRSGDLWQLGRHRVPCACWRRYSTADSVHFICMDWRHMGELLAAGRQTYDTLLNVCVWVKDNDGMGSFYRSRHELVFVFRNGKRRHRNNIQLGQYGRNRTNVWEYPGVNTLSRRSDEGNLLALHPTVKPVALVADAILDCSARGEIVLDAFIGSGSTLIAAERVGRICFGIEIDPLYVDVAIRRWQQHTGDHAIHAVTGKRFSDITADSEVRHD